MATGNLRGGVLPMTAANVVALAMAIAAYLAYSRLLTPGEYGIYAGALAISRLGTMALDGGLKVVLIKHSVPVSQSILRALFLGSSTAAVLTWLLLVATVVTATFLGALSKDTALFFAFYGGAYFATYPFLFIPLAELERTQKFRPVAKVEALTISIEYALPAILWVAVKSGFWSFVIAAWLARALRSAMVAMATDDHRWLTGHDSPDWTGMKRLFREGLGLQIAVMTSILRDSLHLIIVGTWFGKEWAGLYAWALQLCAVSSQVFVQTATRVGLPALRNTNSSELRWQGTQTQIIWLTILCATPLAFLPHIADAVNTAFFESKWIEAIHLLPFLIARMLPSLVTTPLASLILIERSAKVFATANVQWTVTEILAAILLLYWLGPLGFAWSSSFMAWFGMATFSSKLPYPAIFKSLFYNLILRPSLWISMAFSGLYWWATTSMIINNGLVNVLALASFCGIVCLLIEERGRILVCTMLTRRMKL